MTHILLDPSIRDWVLFPVVLIVILVGILRYYLSILMNGSNKINVGILAKDNVTARAGLLISAGEYLPHSSFEERAKKMINEDLKRGEGMEAPMPELDPSMMSGLIKSQILMVANNFGLMMLISVFFSGFVVAQLPFGIPMRLKDMMQRGIAIDDLDCSYVTSISFYLMVLSGSNGLLQLLLGGDVAAQAAMNTPGQMPQTNAAQPTDYKKVWAQAIEELKFHQQNQRWVGEHAPKDLLKEWKEVPIEQEH